MHDKSKFLSWVADPWTKVSDGSMFPVHLAKLEVVLRLGLKTPSFTPGFPILLWFRQIVLLSGDVQLRMFLLSPTLFHVEPIMNAFDVFVLSVHKMLIGSSTREFSRTFVSGPMRPPMTAGSRSPTPTDKLRNMSTMWVSAIGSLLGSTYLMEAFIVSTCSSDS